MSKFFLTAQQIVRARKAAEHDYIKNVKEPVIADFLEMGWSDEDAQGAFQMNHDTWRRELKAIGDAAVALRELDFKEAVAQCYRLERLAKEVIAQQDELLGIEPAMPKAKAKSFQPGTILSITIRPPPMGVSLPAFHKQVEKYARCALFTKAVWTLEQAGKSAEELGHGMHTHMLGQLCQSMAISTLIKRTMDQFGKFGTRANCIKIDVAGSPKDLIQNYWLNYVSKDDHKAATQVWDAQWRNNNNLKPLYGDLQDPLFSEPDAEKLAGQTATSA